MDESMDLSEGPDKATVIMDELSHVMNRLGVDNDLNTPDFVLGRYLVDCLSSFAKARKSRDEWMGRPDWKPGEE